MIEQVKRELTHTARHALKCTAVVLLVYIATELIVMWAQGGGK